MSSPKHPGERRSDEKGREVFNRAVTEAATIATQEVARIHRVRLVTQAFFAALLVSAAVGVGLAVLFHDLDRQSARNNALYNCDLVRGLTGAMADFVSNDAYLRQKQEQLAKDGRIVSGYTKIFGKATLAKLYAEADQLDSQATSYWTGHVVPRLNAIAATNCQAIIH